MNQDGTNVPPVGSGLQYLKRKKPSSSPFSCKRRGTPKAKRKEILTQKKPRFEEQFPRDHRGGSEVAIPYKNERREQFSHLPSNNFTKQFIDVHTEELQAEEDIQEEYKALNEALIELSRTKGDDQTQKWRSVWNLDTQLYLHGRMRKYVSLFSEVVTYPVHSAITDDENVEWFLYSGESFTDPSPLAFNISLAICVGSFDEHFSSDLTVEFNFIFSGANHLQDKATSEEFFWQARAQLAGLMDQTDYHVASGLMTMSNLCSSLSMPQQGKYNYIEDLF